MNREFVSDKLLLLGANPANIGFECLVEAVILASADPAYLHRGVSTRLYPEVAEKLGLSPTSVERNIRAEISRIIRNDDRVLMKLGSGMPLGKVNNRYFIAALGKYMVKQYSLQASIKRGIMA